jgi:hypothetical protein
MLRSPSFATAPRLALAALAASAVMLVGAAPARSQALTGAIVDLVVDGGNAYPWERIELPGAQCGNG